jgi:hypothetical protein
MNDGYISFRYALKLQFIVKTSTSDPVGEFGTFL